MGGEDLQLSSAEQASYDAAVKAATPNENHHMLAKMAGEWSFTTKWWASPDSSPRESTGTSTFTVVHGGRFVQQHMQATVLGQPYEGRGLVGYDNNKSKYVSVWTDTLQTSLVHGEGDRDDANMSLTLASPEGSHRPTKTVLKWIDDNHHVLEAYECGPDGQEFKSTEVSYVRN